MKLLRTFLALGTVTIGLSYSTPVLSECGQSHNYPSSPTEPPAAPAPLPPSSPTTPSTSPTNTQDQLKLTTDLDQNINQRQILLREDAPGVSAQKEQQKKQREILNFQEEFFTIELKQAKETENKKREEFKQLSRKRGDHQVGYLPKYQRWTRTEERLKEAQKELKQARNDAQGEEARRRVTELEEKYKKYTEEVDQAVAEDKNLEKAVNHAWAEYYEASNKTSTLKQSLSDIKKELGGLDSKNIPSPKLKKEH